MAVTIDLQTKSNRSDTHRQWEASGTTVGTGSLQTARWSWWLIHDDAIVDSNHTGPVFGHTFAADGSDDGDWTLVLQVLEQGAVATTDEQIDWTHAVTAPTRTYYVDSGAADDTADGLTSGTPKQTIAGARTAASLWWSGTQHVRFLLKAGQTHALSQSFWDASAQGKAGRVLVDRYGAGADPIVDPSSDFTPWTGFGQFSNTNCAADIRNVNVTGTASSNNAPIVQLSGDTAATSPDDHSHVFVGITGSSVGGLLKYSGSGYSEAEIGAGADDCVAAVDCAVDSMGDYGIYGGWRYLLLDGVSITNHGDAATAPFRCYGNAFAFIRGLTAGACEQSLRVHSVDGWTSHFTRWNNICETVCYDAYTWSFNDNDGSGAGTDIFRDIWVHGGRANASPGGSAELRVGGSRARISVRANWLRRQTIVLGSTDTDNDDAADVYVECNTSYGEGFAGGDPVFLTGEFTATTGSLSGLRNQSNFIYLGSGSGTNFFSVLSGSGNWAQSVITASDYNVILCNGPSVNFYRGVTGGNDSLANWQAASAFDDNSFVGSGSTHGLTTIGASNTDDNYDFHIGATSPAYDAGMAVPGADIDYDGHLRVTTHDAGADDADATDPPPEPDLAAVQEDNRRWRPFGMLNLGLGISQTI